MNKQEQVVYLNRRHTKLPNGQIMLDRAMFVYKKVSTYTPQFDNLIANAFNSKKELGDRRMVHKVIGLRKSNFTLDNDHVNSAIANLILPAGTIVNLPNDNELKMRADKAIVHSVVRMGDKKQVHYGVATVDGEFLYPSVKIFTDPNSVTDFKGADEFDADYMDDWMQRHLVKPEEPFCMGTGTCDSGIHFFLELKTALNY